VLVAALRARTAMGVVDGVVAVRVSMLGMSVLIRRPRGSAPLRFVNGR
jgi:hypothetical protein